MRIVAWPLSLLIITLAGCGDSSAGACSGLPDRDGDGHRSVACGGADCDDTDPDRFPGNFEVCDDDDHDEDCNPATFGERDRDDDGAFDAACCNQQGGGPFLCGNDCDDSDDRKTPGNQEICNGIDDDCSGTADDGVAVEMFTDHDGDGFGEPGTSRLGCPGDVDMSLIDGDCDDGNAQIFPGSIVCTDMSGQFPGAYDFCQFTGTYKPGTCPSGQVCVQQPGGHAVCEI